MKKTLLIVLGCLAALVTMGVVIFVVTFDATRYRSWIESQLSSATGYAVAFDDLKLGWEKGLSLNVRNLTVIDPGAQAGANEVIAIDSVSAVFDVFALLSREIKFGKIILRRPKISLGVDKEGQIDWPAGGSTVSQNSREFKGGPAPLFLQGLEVTGGQVQLLSVMTSEPLVISDIELDLTSTSLLKPIRFDASLRFAPNEDPIRANGKIALNLTQAGVSLENAAFDIPDLASLPYAWAFKSLPQLGAAPLFSRIEGRISGKIKQLSFANDVLTGFDVSANVDRGAITLPAVASPVTNIKADILTKDSELRAHFTSLDIGTGSVSGELVLSDVLTSNPDAILDLRVQNVNLSDVIRPAQNEVYLTGLISAGINMRNTGQDASLTNPSLRGQNEVFLQNGVLHNLNIMREIFRKISIIPGLHQRLETRLPQDYLKRLKANDTALADVRQAVVIQDRTVFLRNIDITTDSLKLTGDLRLFADTSIEGFCMVLFDAEFSDALIRSVEELNLLADEKGRLQLPVQVSGTVDKPEILPDVKFIASKVAVNKAVDVIGSLLQKKTQDETPAAGSATQQAKPQPGSREELIGNILNAVLTQQSK